MFDSFIRVAILSTPGHPPFPETCVKPVRITQYVDFEQFISDEADLYIMASQDNSVKMVNQLRSFPAMAGKTVLINAVDWTGQFSEQHWFRYNGWPGFGRQPVLEIGAGGREIPEAVRQFALAAGLTCLPVPDHAGLVRPRILAMIINEAFLALGEGLSSKTEIDTAMKLGTGYPFGPFEWSAQIGLHRVWSLLEALSAADPRYSPAPAMVEAVLDLQNTLH